MFVGNVYLIIYHITLWQPGRDAVLKLFEKFMYTLCRIRWSKGVEPPDCRQPRAMGAIEKAMRNSKNRRTPFIFEPVLGMVFDSRAEAY
jgi:hypothetical protein